MRYSTYISCPSSVDELYLIDVIDTVIEMAGDSTVHWRARGDEYNSSFLKNSKAVIFILPKNKFSINIDNFPSNIKFELDTAIKEGKDLYIAYKNIYKEIHIYEARIAASSIIGIPGNLSKRVFKDKTNSLMSKTIEKSYNSEIIKKNYISDYPLQIKDYPLQTKDYPTPNKENIILLMKQ